MRRKVPISLIIIIVLGLVAVVGLYLVNKRSIQQRETAITPKAIKSDAHIEEDQIMEPLSIEKDKDTLVANLVDVTNGNATGTGYILRKDGGLKHTVVANLPDPTEDDFYEGWLVQQEPTLKFFSTGIMEKDSDGKYSLSYQSHLVYEGFNFVVITLESIMDTTPEAHILEGTAR